MSNAILTDYRVFQVQDLYDIKAGRPIVSYLKIRIALISVCSSFRKLWILLQRMARE